MAEDSKLKTGRFARFAKLASLSARLSTDLVARGVKKVAGTESLGVLGPQAAERLVAALGDLKGLAMKVGQSISMDPDLLTPEVRAVVARLQNQAPPMPFTLVKSVIERELGGPLEERFAQFDEAPLAAASLGQVHRAQTRQGQRVAVKVQYPDIAQALLADLQNLGGLVSVVSASTGLTHGKGYFEELREALLEELDYRAEAQRAHTFRAAAAHLPALVVPGVDEALSSERVLTMELLEGQTVKDFMHHRPERSLAEVELVALLLTQAIWGPFLKSGLIHADPHPGNFLLLPDGRLGVLDFGAIKQLSPAWLEVNRTLFAAAVAGRPVDGVQLSLACGFQIDDPTASRAFIEQVVDIATRPVRTADFDYGRSGINKDLRLLFMRNALALKGIRPPKEAVQFYRAIGGLSQNLETLQARADFRAEFTRLLAA